MKKTAVIKYELKLCDRNRSFVEILNSIREAINQRDGVEWLKIIEEELK